MMAASCKNLTFSSSSGTSALSVFTAISFVAPDMTHCALHTSPNCPVPTGSKTLYAMNTVTVAYYVFKFNIILVPRPIFNVSC